MTRDDGAAPDQQKGGDTSMPKPKKAIKVRKNSRYLGTLLG